MRHLILGTFLIALGLWGISTWWDAFALAMQALVPLTALALGVLAVLSSYSRLSATHASGNNDGETEEERHAGD